LLVKRFFFLLNAAFAMTILDLISRNNNNNNNNNNNKACYTYVGEEKCVRGYGGDSRRKKDISKKCVLSGCLILNMF
jgi:hypothetical protein